MHIPLQNSADIAVVDEQDYAVVSAVTWRLHPTGYAYGRINGKKAYMHRLVLNAPQGAITDHVNGNKLDNRRENLRICSHAENMRNRRKHKNNRSGVKGVYLESRDGRRDKWIAQIRSGNVQRKIGRFDDLEAAELAYQLAAEKYHGVFARLT